MQEIKFYKGENIPLELHKVRVVQKLHLVPIERRLEALQEGHERQPGCSHDAGR